MNCQWWEINDENIDIHCIAADRCDNIYFTDGESLFKISKKNHDDTHHISSSYMSSPVIFFYCEYAFFFAVY